MTAHKSRDPVTEAAGTSVPERIAEAIDYDIAAQHLALGERLVETQLSTRFGVSRGSVREALRLLSQRGSVEIKAGRGAVVTGYSLERLADVFAVGGMLIALGARYVARHRRQASLERIAERMRRVETMAANGFSPPLDFATAIGGVMAAIVVESGNPSIREQVSAVLNRSVWRAMWEHPCDHLTVERQVEEAAALTEVLRLIHIGDADGAEIALRGFHQAHAGQVVSMLARQRGEREPPSMPLALSRKSPAAEDRLARIERQLSSLTSVLVPDADTPIPLRKVR
jgi:DNA-binding GntR family transcriptional regulator